MVTIASDFKEEQTHMLRVVRLILCGIMAIWLPTTQASSQFTGLAVFGDNIADSGNIPAILQQANAAGAGPFDSNFPPDPPYFGNRFSNGRIAAEILADLLGIAESRVDNRAVGNAFSDALPVSLAGGALIGNGSAIPGPIGRGLFPLNDSHVRNQVAAYLAQNRPGAADLMLLYASANDGALALNTIALTGAAPDQAASIIAQGAQTNGLNTAASARTLIDAGARQVVIVALPDIGQTPSARAGGLAGATAATGFSLATNAVLAEQAAALNRQTAAVVTVFDSFTLLGDIVANPLKYGLSNVTDPCIATPACVADPQTAAGYLFWDAFFPTTTVHGITAAAIADTVQAPKALAAQGELLRMTAEDFSRHALHLGSAKERIVVQLDRSSWDRDSETFALGYDADVTRLALGISTGIGEHASVGLVLATERGDADSLDIEQTFDVDSLRAALVGRMDLGPLAVRGMVGLHRSEVDDIARVTGVAGQVARSSTDADGWSAMVEAAMRIERQGWTITPALRLGRASIEVDGYAESGAIAMNQIVDDVQARSTFVEGGVTVARAWTEWTLSAEAFHHRSVDDEELDIDSRLASVVGVARQLRVDAPDERFSAVELSVGWSPSKRSQWALWGRHLFDGHNIEGNAFGIRFAWSLER